MNLFKKKVFWLLDEEMGVEGVTSSCSQEKVDIRVPVVMLIIK